MSSVKSSVFTPNVLCPSLSVQCHLSTRKECPLLYIIEPDPFLVLYEEQTLDSGEGQAAGPALFSGHLSGCTEDQDHLKKEFKNIFLPTRQNKYLETQILSPGVHSRLDKRVQTHKQISPSLLCCMTYGGLKTQQLLETLEEVMD